MCLSVQPFTRFEFDRAYVERLVARDAATEGHFTQYFGDLLSIKLRSRLRSPALVDDAKQETFLRVLTAIRTGGGLSSAASLGAFVNSVCNNVLFEVYRAQTRLALNDPDTDHELPTPRASAESLLVDAAERDRVRRAVEALPEKDQTLLRWVFFDERNRDDICRDLGIDRSYLRVLLHRARDRFREEFLRIGDALGSRTASI